MSDARAAFEPGGSLPLPPAFDGLARLVGDLVTFGLMSGLMSGLTFGFLLTGAGVGDGWKSEPESAAESAAESLPESLPCLRFMFAADAREPREW